MEAYLGFRQSYISQQLAVLRESGFIVDRREGWNIFYRVTDTRIFEVLDAARRITGQPSFEAQQLAVACTCPHCSLKPNPS